MSKKVYILSEEGKYVGEGIEDFGIYYVNKTEVAPDPKLLNGDYDVIWNGKEWEYIKVKGIEEAKPFVPEPTPEELQKMEEENKKRQEEWLKQQARELLPHMIELLATSKEFQALLKGAKDADKSI